MRFTLGIIAVFAVLVAFPGMAEAHPLIDKAVAAYENADFETALDAFIEAEGRADLTTDDLLKLFEMRALVYHAMDDEVRMRDDLRRLASVRPTYRLGRLAPPPVQTAFDDVREAIAGGIRIDLSAQALPGRLRLTANVRLDTTEIGRSLEIHSKIAEGEWQKSIGDRAVVSVPGGGKVQYFARLVGPGGATVTQTASESQPRMAEVPGETKPQYIEVEVEAKRKVPMSAIVLWSVAGAALVGAAGVGPVALNKDKELKNGCGATVPPSCTPAQRDKVKRFGRATDALWISGAAMAVTGTVLYFVHRKKLKRAEKENAAKLRLSPWASRREVGASANLTF